MRIGVNTRLLLTGKMDGIGWFTAETVRRIVLAHPEHEFFFFFDRKPDPQFVFATNVTPVTLCPQARHPILWYIFFQYSIPKALKRHKIDIFLSPDGYMSLNSKVPTLTVIHDLNFEHSPDNLKPSHQKYMTYFSPQYARYSTRLATVSNYSKQDIIETYHIEPNKIDVVFDGAHEGYRPLSIAEQQATRRQYTNGCRYFIFISTIIKRKNLATLLTAFDIFKKDDNESMKLLVVGHKVWWKDELARAYNQMQHKEDVIFIGRTEPDVLVRLLGSTTALVYPSLYEGFGIPILEAFEAEVPVITSNCTSMPEVAGDAALLVEPTDAKAIADALIQISSDGALCESLIARGRVQRTRFSWDNTADKLWQSIMKTIGQTV